MKINSTFILEKMAEKGETQSTLAEKTGVSRQAISALLNGRSTPRTSTLAVIARVLGVGLDDIVDFNEQKEPFVRNTLLLREIIKNKMEQLNIADAQSLSKLIGYGNVSTVERLLEGKLSWFPDILSSVLQALDIKDAPLSNRERELLMPFEAYTKDGGMLVRPIPVVAWANAASYITSSYNNDNCINENWQVDEVETILVPAGNREISLAFRVNGVSMEPTLYDNDIILVQKKTILSEIPDKKVVIVKFSEESDTLGVYCKRLRRFGSEIRLMSDNPAGDEFVINESNRVHIEYLGQVIKVQSDRGL